MKLRRFENNKYSNDKYPISCLVKGRDPDLGLCKVIAIDFETNRVDLSNGYIRTSLNIDDYEFQFIPDIFCYVYI